MKKKILLLLAILALGSILAYNYIYQDHRDISEEKAEYTLKSSDLINQFQENATKAQEQYLNKTIEITGVATTKSANSITLNSVIFCTLTNPTQLKTNTTYKLKGRFIGYDDLLEEIKLDQCTIIN